MEALERVALELIDEKKYDEALKFLKGNLKEDKTDAALLELIATVHSLKGNIEDARRAVQAADSVYRSCRGFFKYVNSVLIEGERLLAESKFSDAREMYEIGGMLLPEHKKTLENKLADVADIEKKDAERRDATLKELIKEEEEKKELAKEKVEKKNKQAGSKKKKNKELATKKEEEKNKQGGSKKKKNKNNVESNVQIEETTLLDESPSNQMRPDDSHELQSSCLPVKSIESEEKKDESFTVTCEVTLFRDSCCGTMTSDFSEEIPKSFLNPTPLQVKKFRDLHSICSSDTNLINVENVIRDRVKALPLLVTERVYPLKSFFDSQFEKFLSEDSSTKKTWWNYIAKLFGQIFRDVSRGLMFMFISQYRCCGDLAFNIYVTSEKRGKILPSLNPAMDAHQDIADLVGEMRRVLFLPFEGDKEKNDLADFELPSDLRSLLEFVHPAEYESVPATFLVDHPYFWTVRERVNFTMKLKTLLKMNNHDRLNDEFEKIELYNQWDKKLNGIYTKVYAKGGASKMHNSASMTPGTYKVRAYKSGLDIVRYFGSVYVHVNDKEYNYARSQIMSEEQIERDLLSFFPRFYTDIFECICIAVKRGNFAAKHLREISTYYDKNATHTEALPLVNRFQLTKAANSVFPRAVNWVQYHGLYKNLRIIIAQPDPVSGVGSVGAITESLVIYASIEALKPDLIINAGTAGGMKAKGAAIGDVFLASEVAFRDTRIPIPVFDSDVTLQQALSTPNMIEELNLKIGKLSSGKSSGNLLRDNASIDANDDATVKDMEGAVVAYVANVLKVPVIFLKVVTDIVDCEVSKNLDAGRTALEVTVAEVLDFIDGKSLSEL